MRRERHATVKIPKGYRFDGYELDLVERSVRINFSISGVVLRCDKS